MSSELRVMRSSNMKPETTETRNGITVSLHHRITEIRNWRSEKEVDQ